MSLSKLLGSTIITLVYLFMLIPGLFELSEFMIDDNISDFLQLSMVIALVYNVGM
jgi:hypothetical protein